MKIEEQIIQKITEYVQFNGRSANVMLIHPKSFKVLIKEIESSYGLSFGTAEKAELRYMGMKVCRTFDIEPNCIEVY